MIVRHDDRSLHIAHDTWTCVHVATVTTPVRHKRLHHGQEGIRTVLTSDHSASSSLRFRLFFFLFLLVAPSISPSAWSLGA